MFIYKVRGFTTKSLALVVVMVNIVIMVSVKSGLTEVHSIYLCIMVFSQDFY